MTPKQKKQRKQNQKMIEFLGLPMSFKNYSDAHLRKIIESRKAQIINRMDESGLID